MVQTFRNTTYQTARVKLADRSDFLNRALAWSAGFDPVCLLDSNQHQAYQPLEQDALLAVGAVRSFQQAKGQGAFEGLQNFWEQHPNWLFGHFSYDLKNDLEVLESKHPDYVQFPEIHFFQPQYLFKLLGTEVEIASLDIPPRQLFETILKTKPLSPPSWPTTRIQRRFSKNEYLDKVRAIQQHTLDGDVYELNFCQEFFAASVDVNPRELYQSLNAKARAPFSAFYQLGNSHLLCASPERFIRKKGNTLLSQPIKGTIHRGKTPEEDEQLRYELRHSTKDQAENVMIVDLVRNDFARSCLPGSVAVDELFGIYSFEQVFQMISTISGQLHPEVHFVDAIKHAFPMGSMTGAPKIKSMELIDRYERSKRGLYSGSVGYLTPTGDFDFNVVIRSLQYNSLEQYLSFQVGGAIVYDSVPEKEYAECLLKAQAMLEVLNGTLDEKS